MKWRQQSERLEETKECIISRSQRYAEAQKGEIGPSLL